MDKPAPVLNPATLADSAFFIIMLLTIILVVLSGCAIAAPIAVDAVIGGVSILQRLSTQDALKEQLAELVRLREEIRRLRVGEEGPP